VYETHPIVNSQLLYQIGHGGVRPVGEVQRFDRDGVLLAGGEHIEPDLVIFATGYLPRFEFLGPAVLDADADGRPKLALNTFALREADPRRAAEFWQGIVATPDRRWTDARVKDSTRHWFEISHTVYLRALQGLLGDLEAAR
jgi:hypothetical protein